MTGVSERVAIQWSQYFQDKCSHWLTEHPFKIGGPGEIVEINESFMARWKYHCGQLIPERWIFDGYCCSSGRGFFQLVQNRTAETLLPLVQQYIEPGSVILSDEWAAYRKIAEIDVHPPYEHKTVNHSKHFVDPITGVCTNSIECYWKNCKRRFKTMCGVQSTMLESHLDEFLWRELHAKGPGNILESYLYQLSQFYNVNS